VSVALTMLLHSTPFVSIARFFAAETRWRAFCAHRGFLAAQPVEIKEEVSTASAIVIRKTYARAWSKP